VFYTEHTISNNTVLQLVVDTELRLCRFPFSVFRLPCRVVVRSPFLLASDGVSFFGTLHCFVGAFVGQPQV
jgi:hypothetical protein